jgi:hypothetical protein
MQRIEIMRPGRFRAISGQEVGFSENDLRLTAAAYDAAKAPAPIVIGHPAMDAPAYGWVKGLDFADGTLGAYVGDLEPSFAEAVKAKRYAKVSASFFPPDGAANPRAGIYYLRHVGFLGATAPAVTGLKPVSFAEGAGVALDFAHEADAMAVRDAEESRYGRALARVAELEQREREARGRELLAFCDGLVKEARLPTGLKDLAFAALSNASDDATISFGEGDQAERLSAERVLRRLLSALPPMVSFGEVAKAARDPGAGPGGTPMPEGFVTDPEREALAQRAEAVAAERGIPFAAAVRIAAKEAGL